MNLNLSDLLPKDSNCLWFKRNRSLGRDVFEVYPVSDITEPIAQYNEGTGVVSRCYSIDKQVTTDAEYNDEAIRIEFETFKKFRPEYLVGKPISKDVIKNSRSCAEIYDKLIAGAILIQESDQLAAIGKLERLQTWLQSTDFYKAPASTRFHGAVEHGLIQHHLDVYNKIINLQSLTEFETVDLAEATLVALCHDWCKIGIYEPYMKNVKNKDTGKWESVPGFEYKDPVYPFGHGVTSMFYAQRFFKVSVEMGLAIRHHMGKWHTPDNEDSELATANNNFPLVLMLQFADQLSITKYAGGDI